MLVNFLQNISSSRHSSKKKKTLHKIFVLYFVLYFYFILFCRHSLITWPSWLGTHKEARLTSNLQRSTSLCLSRVLELKAYATMPILNMVISKHDSSIIFGMLCFCNAGNRIQILVLASKRSIAVLYPQPNCSFNSY